MRSFGNTLSSVRGAFYLAGVLWLILFVTFAWIDQVHSDLLSRLAWSFAYSAGIASLPLIGVVTTCAFALHVDASSVSHIFLGRFVISRRSLGDLRAVEIATGWGGDSEVRHTEAHSIPWRESSGAPVVVSSPCRGAAGSDLILRQPGCSWTASA